MKIATWNINGLNARLDYIKLWLQEREADIVGLQELKMTTDRFPHDAFSELGFKAAAHGQKSWNGVAILSRLDAPLEVTQVGLPGQEEAGARLIAAQIGDLHYITVYCPNGKKLEHDDYALKLAWFDSLISFMNERYKPGDDLVLCGDFNIVPAPIDSWNEEKHAGKIFHSDQERSRYQQLLDFGLKDLWRELEPEEPGYSWWDYRAGAFHKKQGLRIDSLLVTESVLTRAEKAYADRHWRKKQEGLTPSDHAPVWAVLAT